MLKRSFAEHHAQKAQPDNQAQVEKAENAIKSLRSKEWPTCYRMCSRSDMESYHKQTMIVKEINERNNKQLLVTYLRYKQEHLLNPLMNFAIFMMKKSTLCLESCFNILVGMNCMI